MTELKEDIEDLIRKYGYSLEADQILSLEPLATLLKLYEKADQEGYNRAIAWALKQDTEFLEKVYQSHEAEKRELIAEIEDHFLFGLPFFRVFMTFSVKEWQALKSKYLKE